MNTINEVATLVKFKGYYIDAYTSKETAWKMLDYSLQAISASDLTLGMGSTLTKNGLFFTISENHPIFFDMINEGWQIA